MGVYSQGCAGAFGIALQQPLIFWGKVIYRTRPVFDEQRCSVARSVMKIFLRVLLSILILPLLILPWAVGKLICRITKPRIDYAGLSLVPDLLDLIREEEEDLSLDLLDLVKEWEGMPLPRGMAPSDYDCLTRSFPNMVGNFQDSDDTAEKRKFCDEVSPYLRVILKKIRSGELKGDQKVAVLQELAEVSGRRPPLWLEGCVRLYSEVVGKKGIAANQILGYVRDYKEGLLLSLCKNTGRWYELNRIRACYAKELGLVSGGSGYDLYAKVEVRSFYDSFLRWLFLHKLRWLFFQKYQDVGKLVNAVCTMINRREHREAIYDELLRIVKDSNTEVPPVEYVIEHYYTKDSEIRPEGVVVLLRHLRVIK